MSLPFQFSNADFVKEDLSLDLAVSLAVLSPFSGSWPLVEGLHSVANCSVPFIRFIAFKIYRWIRRSDLSHPSLDEEAKFNLTPLPIIILWIGEDNSTGQVARLTRRSRLVGLKEQSLNVATKQGQRGEPGSVSWLWSLMVQSNTLFGLKLMVGQKTRTTELYNEVLQLRWATGDKCQPRWDHKNELNTFSVNHTNKLILIIRFVGTPHLEDSQDLGSTLSAVQIGSLDLRSNN
ncbi:hypothetical protein PROFUN_15598 [Planoprotostelium fungivorum]|uniref:Uncharacterized protein n=1 Tax=Planoprotostelium fungivorum TaxID=1890364 RepID=A0A2P6MV51_9EUKA|nr:hypothetical protein PROFUN_15598 [Planoprotostelium fungivorum]